MKEKQTHFIIIPAEVLLSKKIPANAKLLYGEILYLCNDKGYCWASNNHFAELFGVSVTSISLWVTSLRENGFIECNVWENPENYTRQIFLTKSLRKVKAPFTFLITQLLNKMSEESLRKLKIIYKGQEHPSGNAPAIKDDFDIETKEWKDKNGQVHGRDSIDYES